MMHRIFRSAFAQPCRRSLIEAMRHGGRDTNDLQSKRPAAKTIGSTHHPMPALPPEAQRKADIGFAGEVQPRSRFHHTLHYHLCLLPNTNTGTLPSARTSDV